MIRHIKNLIVRLRQQERMRLSKRLKMFSIGTGSRFLATLSEFPFVDYGQCSITVGDGSLVRGTVNLQKEKASFSVGSNTAIGGGSTMVIVSGISIGNNVLVSYECLFMDNNGHNIDPEIRKNDLPDLLKNKPKNWEVVTSAPIIIEDNAWIGARVIILKGVTIGEASIVSSGSVVTKNVEPYTIVGGNPAKIIGTVPR